MTRSHVPKPIVILAGLLLAVVGGDAALAADEKAKSQTLRPGGRSFTATQDYKYRFTVPYDLQRIPREVSQVVVKCEVCENLVTGGSRCGAPRVSASQTIQVRQGAASGQAKIEIREHLTKQTSLSRNTPVTEGLSYACYLEFNGNAVADEHGRPRSIYREAEGTTAVVVSSGPLP